MGPRQLSLNTITDNLLRSLRPLKFSAPVSHVYNPLIYARGPFDQYAARYGSSPRKTLLVGMNPGPWGMAQTGVPFGEVSFVRDWLDVGGDVKKPVREHEKRPVLGFDCPRSEVSGKRLWGWARDRFRTPERFFAKFFIVNYCPLCFLESSGRNLTPDKLPANERKSLFDACDKALRQTVEFFQPSHVIGIGKFAADRARIALDGINLSIGDILHPSPASPLANADWPGQVDRQLAKLGIHIPPPRH